MSDQPETQVEQPTEQPIEQVEEAPKPKRTRGPNKKPCKTADPNYFKDYYINKTKPNLYIKENVTVCPCCNKQIFVHNMKRHQNTKSCQLVKLQSQLQLQE